MTEITRDPSRRTPRRTGPRPMRDDPYHPVYPDTGDELPAVKPRGSASDRHATPWSLLGAGREFFHRHCRGHAAGSTSCDCP